MAGIVPLHETVSTANKTDAPVLWTTMDENVRIVHASVQARPDHEPAASCVECHRLLSFLAIRGRRTT